MFRVRDVVGAIFCAMAIASVAQAQAQPPVAKPQPPPPVAGTTAPAAPAPAKPATPAPAPARTPTVSPAPTKVQPPADPTSEAVPTDAMLGVRVYPASRYLGSYDAGRGQRYYLFGTLQPFAEMVTFYKNELKDKGELVFDVPPTHMFDLGKFKEDTMAFPPSVTIKDFTWNGSAGYANPKPGTAPTAFPTVIQIVPPPPAGPIR